MEVFLAEDSEYIISDTMRFKADEYVVIYKNGLAGGVQFTPLFISASMAHDENGLEKIVELQIFYINSKGKLDYISDETDKFTFWKR